MPGLVRDRYFEYAPERAWDLVTGEAVSTTGGEDEPKPTGPAPSALIELLDHGVEGFRGGSLWTQAGCRGTSPRAARPPRPNDEAMADVTGTLEECRAGCSPLVAAASDSFK